MKIAYNALPTSRLMTGSCRYYRNLIKNITDNHPDWIIENWVHKQNMINYGFQASNYIEHKVGNWCSKRPVRILYEQTMLGSIINNVNPDIFHGNGFVPAGLKCPAVVTIHDLSYHVNPKRTTAGRSLYFRKFTEFAARKAKAIMTESEASKKDIEKYIYGTKGKIHVIPIGVEDYFKPVDDKYKIEAIRKKYQIEGKFFLYLGTLEPGKNITKIIYAFESIVKSFSLEASLIIAGKKGWLFDEIFNTAQKTGLLNKKIFFLGFVPEEELPTLYNAAECLVFPSTNEGFGLPPLESMSCGTPVITSHISSLPEVVGDAALMVDPYDVTSISKAMHRIYGDENLRKELSVKGLERAKLFSWKAATDKVSDIYGQILSKNNTDI